MMYRPPADLRLWDTWIFPAKDEFHLFHLQSPGGGSWDALGHAVSTDLVHWKPCDCIPMRGPEGAWDSAGLLTGMVIRHGDQYAMTFGSIRPGGHQEIGVMFSPDLYNWTKYPGNPVLSAGPPYRHEGEVVDWRDAYMMKVDDGYEALVCARMPDGRACVARVASKDLIRWQACEPIAIPDVAECEVPEYFRMGDKHYVIFACAGAVDDRLRKKSTGTRYLVSDDRLGPYVMLENSLLLGSGNGRFDCYVGRTIEVDGQRMLYYHNCGPRPAEGAPKVVREREDGSLWAEYWPGLAGLETGVVIDGIGGAGGEGTDWEMGNGRAVGRNDAGPSFHVFPTDVSDFHLTCTVNVAKGCRAAIVFRYDEKAKAGSAVVLDARTGAFEMSRVEGQQITMLDAEQVGLKTGEEHVVRIFARSEFADCYLDDRFVFSTVLNEAPLSGKIGFAVDFAKASFRELRVASLEAEG